VQFDEPVFKTKQCGKESTLFNCLYKHSFGGLGADTLTFCESTPFSGEVGGGGGVGCRLFQKLNCGSLFSLKSR
jgi:hypothetical protein